MTDQLSWFDEKPADYVSPLKPAPPPPVTVAPIVVDDPVDEELGEVEVAPGQSTMFGDDEEFHIAWREWKGMPEFAQEDLSAWKSLIVNFASIEDYRAFAELVDQRLSPRTRSIWYPAAEIGHFTDKRYAAVEETP